ncbi:3139_t:CDS:2 [Entrophospora sp. SA101]|nr:3139_t:CDS:2 [Entrophospora sp. SA101]
MEGVVSSSNNNGSCGVMNKNNSNIENELNFINLTQNSDGDDDGKEDSNVKDIQTTATEIEKATDAKAININQSLINNIARTNNIIDNFNNTSITIDYNGNVTTMDNNCKLTDLQISEEEDDNEGKINQEDSIDDVVVLENIVEKDEEERQEIIEEIATNIFQQHSNMGFEFESTAITALQEAAETYLIELFQDARLCTIHAKRATLSKEDIELVLNIRG